MSALYEPDFTTYYVKIQSMKKSLFDTSLFSVFRFFVAVRLFYSFFMLLVPRLFVGSRLSRLQFYEPSVLLSVGETIFLLVYLSWPLLRLKLGKFYLPIALGIATIGPIIENYLGIDLHQLDEFAQLQSIAGQFQVAILLFIPLILISWEYKYKIVLAWCGFQALLEVVATLPIIYDFSPRPFLVFNILLFRTLIYLLVGYVVVRLVSEERQQYSKLATANQRLASYAVTLEQLTVSRERNRMARELHDTLAHTLSAVSIELEAVNALWDNNNEKAKVMLEQSLSMTRSGLNESRRAIQSLRAAPLEDLGLVIALENLARSTAERIGVSLSLELPDDLPSLNPEVEHSVFRISEEALRNVVEHANARHVYVSLCLEDHRLQLEIMDDGSGFVSGSEDSDHHFGLKGMHEYADTIGATLTVESIPDKGTKVLLILEGINDPSSDL